MVDDNENKAGGGAEGGPVGGESREGRGGRNDRRGGGYGARRWRCPDPNCGKYNSGENENCKQCNTSQVLAKKIDEQKQERSRGWGRGGGGRGRGGGRGGGGRRFGGRGEIQPPSDCPIVSMFEGVRGVLDARHDKMERIVKLSRDITIESKRIIFTLHRIKSEEDKDSVLYEAEGKLNSLKKEVWRYLAIELRGEDDFQFLRNYTAGLQEWIEALSFYHYICYNRLITWEEVQKELVFQYRISTKRKNIEKNTSVEEKEEKIEEKEEKIEDKEEKETHDNDEKQGEENYEKKDEEKDEGKDEEEEEKKDREKDEDGRDSPDQFEEMKITVPQTDYILGLADLTGELMRNAINSLTSGHLEACFVLLTFLQNMHEGFLQIPDTPYQVSRKMSTLKQSMRKVEDACYAINVRGSEMPKSHLADIFERSADVEDGYE